MGARLRPRQRVLRLELTDGRIPGALCARPVVYFRSECNATATHLASFGNTDIGPVADILAESCNSDTLMLFSCNLTLTEATQKPDVENRPTETLFVAVAVAGLVNGAMRRLHLRINDVASARVGQAH